MYSLTSNYKMRFLVFQKYLYEPTQNRNGSRLQQTKIFVFFFTAEAGFELATNRSLAHQRNHYTRDAYRLTD